MTLMKRFTKEVVKTFRNLWFSDTNEHDIYVNDVAIRIRAGIFLAIPLYMGLTLYDVAYMPTWEPIINTATDTYETDWDGRTIYRVDATRRVFEYSTQSWILIYGLFELFASMFVITSRLSPTILLATVLARNKDPVWKPLVPKRYAWIIGISLMSLCLVFFNPDTFAEWVNAIRGKQVLPTTENYMPAWIPNTMIWVCLAFMWLESVIGFCVGCKVYALMCRLGIHKEPCEACNNIDWEAIARRNAEKLALQDAQEEAAQRQ